MPLRLARRAVLALPLLLAACGGDDVPAPVAHRDYPPLRYGYLPPIPLNVERVQMAEGFVPPSGDDEVSASSPVDFAETLFAMARDRLKPVATSGTATFRILRASVIRHHDTLDGVLEVRLDVSDADGNSTGFAVARATADHSGQVTDLPGAVYDMLKSMMDELNVEFEYQIRNKLRGWVVDTTPPPAAAPAPDTQPPPTPDKPEAPLPPAPPAPPRT